MEGWRFFKCAVCCYGVHGLRYLRSTGLEHLVFWKYCIFPVWSLLPRSPSDSIQLDDVICFLFKYCITLHCIALQTRNCTLIMLIISKWWMLFIPFSVASSTVEAIMMLGKVWCDDIVTGEWESFWIFMCSVHVTLFWY
jgi:hypothetical protein